MSLLQRIPDEWTPSGIKSTFWIIIPNSPKSNRSKAGPAPVCGLGWRFSCSANLESSSRSTVFVGADGGMLPAWRIAIMFDPHLVSSADYGCLTFSVHASHLLVPKDASDSTTFTLPDNRHMYHESRQVQIGTYIYTVDDRRKITPSVTITVRLPASTGLSIPRSIDQRLEHVLVDTMYGKEAVDLKFYAFTGRRNGYVARPQAIFAKASLLRGYSESLDILISGGDFAESRLVDLDDHKIDTDILEDYDYMSDSDLDTDDEGIEDDASIKTPRSHSHSVGVSTPASLAINIPLPLSRPQSPTRRMGRVVIVRGTAFKTWKALLYYMYTSKLDFSTEVVGQVVDDEYGVPRCSAKSMYRLADKLGLDELKAVSLSSIRTRLSQKNIIQEVFSKFTSIYPEVQDVEVKFLLNNFPTLKEKVDTVLEGLCKGERPHCGDVLRKIVAGRNAGGPIAHAGSGSRPSSPVSPM
ncbi:hypothetical protein FB451DRAFT_1248326 [Mycena latifolia]|nr:hypothetical protein FB451DRAFT_1248326 [Mycena latifolia]